MAVRWYFSAALQHWYHCVNSLCFTKNVLVEGYDYFQLRKIGLIIRQVLKILFLEVTICGHVNSQKSPLCTFFSFL